MNVLDIMQTGPVIPVIVIDGSRMRCRWRARWWPAACACSK